MKKKKPTVRYIKNGVEKVVSLNMFNYSSVCKEIFNNAEDFYLKDGVLEKNGSKVTFNFDLEFIHFDNFKFRKLKKFNCYSNDILCVFENCTFSSNNACVPIIISISLFANLLYISFLSFTFKLPVSISIFIL